MIKSQNLIKQLTSDLRPQKVLWSPLLRTLFWYILLFFLAGLVIGLASDSVFITHKDVSLDSVLILEVVSGLFVSFQSAYIILKRTIPGEKIFNWEWVLLFVLISLFLGSFIWNYFHFHSTVLPPATHDFCELEVFFYGGIGFSGLFYLMKKGIIRPRNGDFILYGFSAGLIPALIMQLVCTFNPGHSFLFHYLPVIVLIVVLRLLFYFFNLKY